MLKLIALFDSHLKGLSSNTTDLLAAMMSLVAAILALIVTVYLANKDARNRKILKLNHQKVLVSALSTAAVQLKQRIKFNVVTTGLFGGTYVKIYLPKVFKDSGWGDHAVLRWQTVYCIYELRDRVRDYNTYIMTNPKQEFGQEYGTLKLIKVNMKAAIAHLIDNLKIEKEQNKTLFQKWTTYFKNKRLAADPR